MEDRPELRLAIALAIGLVIGAERERRKGDGAARSPAGLRTFTLVALLGGLASMFASPIFLAVVGAVVGAAIVAAYVLGERTDPGLTTEIALFLTYVLGAFALRDPTLALAAGVVTAAVLAFRAPLHHAVRKTLSEDELRDALVLAVAALAILPFLPHRAVDPLGVVNPFTLWRLVVVLLVMSGAGYVAQRVLGPRYGLALAGFGSGFVSSSATIAAMGARVKADAALLRPAVAGAAASTVATFVQLAILIGTAAPAVLATLKWPLVAGGATALVYAGALTFHARRAEVEPSRGRAFEFTSALFFAALVTAVGVVSTLAQRWLGAGGALATAALAGFADAHASSAAVASLGGDAAVWGVLAAVSTNTVTKVVLAFSAGTRAFAVRVVVGLALVIAAMWTTALLV